VVISLSIIRGIVLGFSNIDLEGIRVIVGRWYKVIEDDAVVINPLNQSPVFDLTKLVLVFELNILKV
jgi:hypothetical protein